MSGKKTALKVVLIAMSALFNLAFGIAALVVHLQHNTPDPLCGNSNSYLSLSRWLEGFGIANIIIFVGTIPVVLAMNRAALFAFWSIIVGLFGFAWMVSASRQGREGRRRGVSKLTFVLRLWAVWCCGATTACARRPTTLCGRARPRVSFNTTFSCSSTASSCRL